MSRILTYMSTFPKKNIDMIGVITISLCYVIGGMGEPSIFRLKITKITHDNAIYLKLFLNKKLYQKTI